MLARMDGVVRDNAALGRFELDFDGGQGFVTYRRAGDVVTLLHAEVPPALEVAGTVRGWSARHSSNCAPRARG